MITKEDIEAMVGSEYYSRPEEPSTFEDMVRQFSRTTGQKPVPSLYAALIQEEFDEWRSEYLRDTKEPQLKELADLLYVVYGYAYSMGWDVTEAFRRVHTNNVGRCFQDDGSVKRRDDGKIIKNPGYPKVDLSDLV